MHMWRPLLHPQTEYAPCRGDREIHNMTSTALTFHLYIVHNVYGVNMNAYRKGSYKITKMRGTSPDIKREIGG